MSDTEKNSFENKDGAKEITISIFGKEEKHNLPDDMTI
jgi:hypothetical protein